MASNVTPKGYWRDGQGRLVPVESIGEIDKERDSLVREVVKEAQQVSGALGNFKVKVLGDIRAFIELSAERFKTDIGGAKGNVTLTTFDGEFKLQRAMADNIEFDERLQIAKKLVDECITKWSEGSRSEIRTLVRDAFKVNKKGQVSTGQILGLRRLAIEDETWELAMKAIGESIHVSNSTTYIRLYQRDEETGEYKPIPLDVSKV